MTRRRTVAWVGAGAGVVALGIALASFVLGGGSETAPAQTTHPQASTPPSRTVVVAFGKEKLPRELAARACGASSECANGQDTLSLVRFVGGIRPPASSLATVLTDTNCDPDAYGISHCLNALRLADGRSLVVRHSHSMHMFPCLAPGDTVELLTVGGFASA